MCWLSDSILLLGDLLSLPNRIKHIFVLVSFTHLTVLSNQKTKSNRTLKCYSVPFFSFFDVSAKTASQESSVEGFLIFFQS